MRIGFFADEYLPRVDGVITSMTNLAHGLRARGHQVFFIVPSYPASANDRFVLRLPSTPVPLSDNVRAILPSAKAASDVKRLSLDIIHSHTPFMAAQLARKIAREEQIPHVTTFHTLLPVLLDYYPLRTRSYFPAIVATIADILVGADLSKYHLPPGTEAPGFKRTAWKWTGAFLDSVNFVISPSEHFARSLQALGADTPIEVVPNALDMTQFPARTYRRHHPLRLVAVGRLSPEKRQYELIQAARRLDPARFELSIIGDGPDRQRLENLVLSLGLKHISLTGRLSPTLVRRELRRADVGVLASHNFDNQPMTVLEYLASALPVLYCDPQLTEGLNQKNSLLSKPDVKSLAKSLSVIESAKLGTLSAAARRSALDFTHAKAAQRVEKIYQQLAV